MIEEHPVAADLQNHGAVEPRKPACLCCCLSTPYCCPCCRVDLCFRDEDDNAFQWYDFVLEIVGAFFYLFDIVTDLRLTLHYFQTGDTIFAALTLLFFLLSYGVNYFFVCCDGQDQCRPKVRGRIIPVQSQSGPGQTEAEEVPLWSVFFHLRHVVSSIKIVYYGLKSRQRTLTPAERHTFHSKMRTLRYNNAFFAMCETVVEAAPQFILQLYITMDTKPKVEDAVGVWRLVSVVLSWVFLAKGVTSCVAISRNKDSVQAALSWIPYKLLYFVLRLADTGARLLCLALFVHAFRYWVIAVVCFHLSVASVGFLSTLYLAAGDRLFEDALHSHAAHVAMLYVSLFCVINIDDIIEKKRQCKQFLAIGLFFHAENVFMVLMWFHYLPKGMEWFRLQGLVLVLAATALSLVLQTVYNTRCHPPVEATTGARRHRV